MKPSTETILANFPPGRDRDVELVLARHDERTMELHTAIGNIYKILDHMEQRLIDIEQKLKKDG